MDQPSGSKAVKLFNLWPDWPCIDVRDWPDEWLVDSGCNNSILEDGDVFVGVVDIMVDEDNPRNAA